MWLIFHGPMYFLLIFVGLMKSKDRDGKGCGVGGSPVYLLLSLVSE